MAAGALPLKGWITGWIGMLVAFVGYDAIHGVPRFTYGRPTLYDGISYVAVLIGMFGLAEILRTLPARDMPTIPSEGGPRYSRRCAGCSGYWPAAVPLGHHRHLDRRHSRRRRQRRLLSRLRHRAPPRQARGEGEMGQAAATTRMVCAETANNANIGGSMLPTLALGIPGNAPAAALLAALHDEEHGRRPDDRDRPSGPDLLHLRRADRRQLPDVLAALRAHQALREALLPCRAAS